MTVNGVTTVARVGRMGGENLLRFSKQFRAELGVEIGHDLDIVIAVGAQPRTVESPAALSDAFAGGTAARTAFDALAPSHREDFAVWLG